MQVQHWLNHYFDENKQFMKCVTVCFHRNCVVGVRSNLIIMLIDDKTISSQDVKMWCGIWLVGWLVIVTLLSQARLLRNCCSHTIKIWKKLLKKIFYCKNQNILSFMVFAICRKKLSDPQAVRVFWSLQHPDEHRSIMVLIKWWSSWNSFSAVDFMC